MAWDLSRRSEPSALLRSLLDRFSIAPVRAGAVVVAALAAWGLGAIALPSGLPAGIVLYGAVLGGLSSLIAIGLVLVYRSARIINFAQADMGSLAAAVAVMMVIGWHLPYFLALVVGLGCALGTGAAMDSVITWRFSRAPRLIVTLVTLGFAQIIGAGELGLPSLFTHAAPLKSFTTPFNFKFTVFPIVFNGNHVVAIVIVPLVLVGLWWFLERTDTGIAIRGAADSNERAQLLGIPVRRLSRVTWMVAGGLSGIGVMLTAPILGPQLGVNAGPEVLLAPLAAAVVARFESLTVAFATSIAIGVFQQAVFWSYPQSHIVDVAMFALVWVALLTQRRRKARSAGGGGLGDYVAVREVRPMSAVMRRLPEVRWARVGLLAAIAALAVCLPLALSGPDVTLLTYTAIYGIIAVSLVVLTGWAGQVSLGQFAFVGVGSATTAALLVHAHADFLLALLASAAVGAATAVVVGIPALRMPGLMLAVATLAFAVPVSTYLLSSAYFPALNPPRVLAPVLLGHVSLGSITALYEFCLAVFFVTYLLARNFRRLRSGRAAVAGRDNEPAAAAFGIRPWATKLTAFALSGAMAGVAGGLYVVKQGYIGFSGYNPELSIIVFTMVVVGGLGSLPGALLGALYVTGTQYFIKNGAGELLATGAGLLVLLMFVPGGLGEVMYSARDLLLRSLARAKQLDVPWLTTRAGAHGEDALHGALGTPQPAATELATPQLVGSAVPGTGGSVACQGVDASYGSVQVLFGVDLDVEHGEILALLGTNGAGKSTLLRAIAGLMPAAPGRVSFLGRDVTDLSPESRVGLGLVTVPGGRGVFGSLTVAENLRLGGWLMRRDAPALADATRRVLDIFPLLSRRMGTRAVDLSGGEQQMLTLAQAMLCRPRVLLVDELSLGLAPSVVSELLDVVRGLAEEGVSIVVVEQSLNVAAALAPRAVFLERGVVRFCGPTADLVEQPELARSVFLQRPLTEAMAVAASTGSSMSDLVGGAGAGEGKGGNGHGVWDVRPADMTGVGSAAPLRFEVRGISQHFGGVAALESVTIGARAGEVLGVIGANGAGKTTLFDIASGFVAPDSGQVLLDGADVTHLSAAGRSMLGLGRVFQDARVFPSLTVAEALAVALDRHVAVRDPLANMLGLGAALDAQEKVRERVEELLVRTGLEAYRDAFISELSTGTRRIVEIAATLGHEPSVLLLDEPSSGIAQRESEALGGLLMSVRESTGATFVIIEHDIALVSSLADRMVCLHLGEVIAEGTPDEVLNDDGVVAAYLGTGDTVSARS